MNIEEKLETKELEESFIQINRQFYSLISQEFVYIID